MEEEEEVESEEEGSVFEKTNKVEQTANMKQYIIVLSGWNS